MEERVIEECKNAFQVGPAYFENGKDKIGISDTSPDRGRRNVLIRLTEGGASEKLYLWSTVSPISQFDTMVVVETITDRLEMSIKWAVGLQDRAFLSGPLIFSGDGSEDRRPLRLAATDKPTGALLVFFDSPPSDDGSDEKSDEAPADEPSESPVEGSDGEPSAVSDH